MPIEATAASAMFWPLAAQVALTFVVLVLVLLTRIRSMSGGTTTMDSYKVYDGAMPDYVVQASRNYSNQYEMPVLFFVGGVLVIALGKVDDIFVLLGWIHVGARAVHALIHLTINQVAVRLLIFAVSALAVAAIWIRLALAL
ncbi:MAPEG family protein [Zavarzinia compransoris]|uniref:MAPEG family protein n=1 Tax=Zavarzinia marina TaxID=2911065 RepID=UPI001F2E3215|nr:MAPEG family protein [Zavarzinia marina]MCF4164163.1 MAPEG family protein [Zavarzinia marina]